MWILVLCAFILELYHNINVSYASSQFTFPSQFCNGLPNGQFCNINFPRELITCPSSTSFLCPIFTYCKENPLDLSSASTPIYTAQCLPDPNSKAVQICNGVPAGDIVSRCIDDSSIVECPGLNIYYCPPDLVCQNRGLRAYCVKPILQNVFDAQDDSCSGFTSSPALNVTICDAINLRKVINCPSRSFELCTNGQMCSSLPSSNGQESGCVNWESDLLRFCSNKPLFSSYCLPNSIGQFILCSANPMIFSCPSSNPSCSQLLSITARCSE